MKRERIKALIELSDSFEEADKILEEYANILEYTQKIAYLQGMFDCEIAADNRQSAEADYKALLTAIVNKKWSDI